MAGNDFPMSGGIPYAVGQPSIVRIPIPNTDGLAIEFKPRGYIPTSGSTSTLFYQDITGKRHLRLDYGYNVKTKTVNYHWNQQGTHANFGVTDHTSTGRGAAGVYKAAKYFRHAGRVLMVVGVAMDIVSIVKASNPLRRATQVVSGMALAWAGCKVVGAGGALGGSFVPVVGTGVGGVGGCVIGGIAGYWGGSRMGDTVYTWAKNTIFTKLTVVAAP